MSSVFLLEVMTPERHFFHGEVEAVTVSATDGFLTVLKGHAPLICGLKVGTMQIKRDGEWKTAFHSDGFMEVRPDCVMLFAQACEWPEEIDRKRAQEAKERIERHMREKQSIYEHRHCQISLARAMTRLRVKKEQD